ncbi:uncharacterized protein LOC134209335 [Armigeres subalbatus]|uniref:uncharacterized protein LOC134209335 n=1 Tax=Armigeres subalbatus TaxID=124917 RepID=UPI002ED601C2
METLRRLYGRPELLVKNLLAKVRRLEAPKSERLDSLMSFGIAVQQLCDHLEAANLRSHLSNPTLLEELVEKLPASIKLEWVRYKREFDEPSLKEFGEFMDRLVVDASEVTTFVAPKKENTHTDRTKHNLKAHILSHNETPSVTGKHLPREPCPICLKLDHRVRNCDKFKQMNVMDRLRAVERFKLCEVCLFPHGNKVCRSRYYCNAEGCRVRHHPLLHREIIVRADCQAHRVAMKPVLFRVVPVTLHHGARSIDTFAFLDEGSSRTLIEASLAQRLGINGVPEPLELTWTSNVVRKELSSRRVDLTISARGGKERYKLASAHTVSALNLPKQSLQMSVIGKHFKHLENIPTMSFQEAESKVLIGLQNLELFAPLESRVGQSGEPIAVRSVLGWTIYGPCGENQDSYQFLGLHGCKSEVDRELNEMIRKYFVMEEVGMNSVQLPEPAEIVRAKEY